jgi:hypothetical protein
VSLLAPAFLWTLAALAPLAAIYFLKVRPRKKPVTAFFLWQRVFTEKKASALFKRLRDVFSLLLMALAFAAIAFALAEPDLAGDERRDLLIVVDHSASMSAGGRLDQAKNQARDLIVAMNGSQRAAVASFADTTHIVEHPTRHRKALLEAVDRIQPSELPSRTRALRSLQPDAEWMQSTRVLLITDGALDEPEHLQDIEILRVGQSEANLGLARADLRPVPGGPARVGLFFVPVSSATEPVQTDITLTHLDSNRILKILPLTVNPGENPAVTLTLDDAPPGRWQAELSHADRLPLDNTVLFYVPRREPLPVAVQGGDPYFFNNVVSAFERSDQLLTLAADPAQARLVLGKGPPPTDFSAVMFHAEGDPLPTPVPKVLIKEHPLLRYLDVESMNFTGACRITAPAGAVVLVADENGPPLLYLIRQGEHTACVINMDPVAAQFYLSTWFPVIVHNAAAHLSKREDSPPSTLPTASQTAFGPVLKSGFHPHGEHLIAASLLSPHESLLNSDAVQTNAKPLASGQSPSYWLLVLALGVLVGESMLYHRRKVG